MKNNLNYDVIIIGGSYAGLSAGMALGRSLRNTLIIDSGLPCNRQTPHSHNFLTQDGNTPLEISSLGKEQVSLYNTVTFFDGIAVSSVAKENGFELSTDSGQIFHCRKLVFATGIKDLLPPIEGFADCWGITVIHCPYCHGYEVKHEKTGIFANGELAYEYAKLISNWTKDLTLFTNGPSTLSQDQLKKIMDHHVQVNEMPIKKLEHNGGQLTQIVFEDGTAYPLKALYARSPFEQHCAIPASLGCELTEDGFLKVDFMQKTTVPGVFACGDNVSRMRSVANAVAQGNMAGAALNKELIDEDF